MDKTILYISKTKTETESSRRGKYYLEWNFKIRHPPDSRSDAGETEAIPTIAYPMRNLSMSLPYPRNRGLSHLRQTRHTRPKCKKSLRDRAAILELISFEMKESGFLSVDLEGFDVR